jgi:O-acetyl-ADP-ribose deacetylase (regulator of RNase III)
MFERGNGSLLEAQVEALINTVNTVGVMGKGLALQFKKAFPDNCKAYEKACRAGNVHIGEMLVFDRGLLTPRWLVNFPTKEHWRSPSQLRYIDEGLVDLLRVVRSCGIRSIAVPPLGCGNGGLQWDDVRPRIERAFSAVPEVRVVLFAPDGAPPVAAMPDRTKRPAMTAGRAAFLAAMAQYQGTGFDYDLTLLEVQKVAYFLHVAGDLEQLVFQPHHYGPYSDALRRVVVAMDGHYLRGDGDGNVRPSTPITLLPGAVGEAEAFLTSQPATQARLARVKEVIDGFETPFGMELLATVHWVTAQSPFAASLEQAITAVHAWSDRKRNQMKPGHIEAAWRRLESTGWLPVAP